MIYCYVITAQQADAVRGKYWQQSAQFNPVQDCQGRWVLSVVEVEQNQNADFAAWCNPQSLQKVEWCPPVTPPAF